jgi:hypothetical protein
MKQIPINLPRVTYQGKVYKNLFKGHYDVCDEGFIFSCKRKQFITPQVNSAGFVTVMLYSGSIQRRYSLGKLILEHFLGPPPDVIHYARFDCYHKDHNQLNNHISNLEWLPRSEILLRAYREEDRRRQGRHPDYENYLKIYKSLPGAGTRMVKAISDDVELVFPRIVDLVNYLNVLPLGFYRNVGTGKEYGDIDLNMCK